MVYREVHRLELRELLRRWQAGESIRTIARVTGLARNTVGKYLSAAEGLGLSLSGSPATDDQLTRLLALGYTGSPHRKPGLSETFLVPHREQIEAWLTKDHHLLTRIQELLGAEGCVVPYSSLRRFVAKERLGAQPKTTVRMAATKPGDYAEMDFLRLGHHLDPATGRRQRVYALLVVLSFSRHLFLWPMLRTRLEDVTLGLEATWRFFGGVPRHLVLDNFPAAVAEPDSLSPRLTKGFLDYAQFRGFLPDPARVRHPKDKPHVERMVPYARERFFAGSSFTDLADMRRSAESWCREVAGSRLHGTTHRQPLAVFTQEERSHLLPLGPEPYLLPQFATLKVHPDHHVEFASALYSVPCEPCPPGCQVELRADAQLVRIYLRGNLVKTHVRRPKGGRSTDLADYPDHQAVYAQKSPERLIQRAAELGPYAGEWAGRLLSGDLPWTRFRQAQKLLRLADRYTPARVDAACSRALAFDLFDVHRLEHILVDALDQEDQAHDAAGSDDQPDSSSPLPARFARPGSAFARASASTPAATAINTPSLGGN
jgi:transposase